MTEFPIWTVYNKPKDFPTKYVARKFLDNKPTNEFEVFDTLEALMDEFKYLNWIPRFQHDDPVIKGVYI